MTNSAIKMGGRLAAALCSLLAISGCVSNSPATIPGAFSPPGPLGSAKASSQVCTVRIGDVKDLRSDRRAAGSLSGRNVYLDDSEAWLRSALISLKRDARLKLVDGNDPGDLVLNVELVNAYMSQRTGTEKSTTVVFKASFERGGNKIGNEIIRGHVDNMNWAAGDGEIRGAFNSAMQDAIVQLDNAVVTYCTRER